MATSVSSAQALGRNVLQNVERGRGCCGPQSLPLLTPSWKRWLWAVSNCIMSEIPHHSISCCYVPPRPPPPHSPFHTPSLWPCFSCRRTSAYLQIGAAEEVRPAVQGIRQENPLQWEQWKGVVWFQPRLPLSLWALLLPLCCCRSVWGEVTSCDMHLGLLKSFQTSASWEATTLCTSWRQVGL